LRERKAWRSSGSLKALSNSNDWDWESGVIGHYHNIIWSYKLPSMRDYFNVEVATFKTGNFGSISSLPSGRLRELLKCLLLTDTAQALETQGIRCADKNQLKPINWKNQLRQRGELPFFSFYCVQCYLPIYWKHSELIPISITFLFYQPSSCFAVDVRLSFV
jgi:hypothetical protein